MLFSKLEIYWKILRVPNKVSVKIKICCRRFVCNFRAFQRRFLKRASGNSAEHPVVLQNARLWSPSSRSSVAKLSSIATERQPKRMELSTLIKIPNSRFLREVGKILATISLKIPSEQINLLTLFPDNLLQFPHFFLQSFPSLCLFQCFLYPLDSVSITNRFTHFQISRTPGRSMRLSSRMHSFYIF